MHLFFRNALQLSEHKDSAKSVLSLYFIKMYGQPVETYYEKILHEKTY